MIIKTIETARELQEEFIAYNRDYYSLEGYEAIIEYFDSIGENWELDVIAICGDFNEESEEYIRDCYNIDEDIEVMDYLQDNTYAVETVDNNILYIVF